jgi:exosome complex component RRP42
MSSTPNQKAQALIAKIERKRLTEAIKQGKRVDGRSPDEYRDLIIETGINEKAEGSAQVKLGKTRILVGVKVDVGEPFQDTPDRGVLTVNAELVPIASPTFEPGPPNENAIELARVVDRGIRESSAIDLKKMCLVPGRKVLIVFVDIYVLDHDGNLIDASALAALASLLNTKMKKIEIKGEEITFKDKYEPLPIINHPIAVTIAKIGDSLVCDPCLEEEYVVDARLTVTLDDKGRIRAMQKGGLGTFNLKEIKESIDIAGKKSDELRKKITEVTK